MNDAIKSQPLFQTWNPAPGSELYNLLVAREQAEAEFDAASKVNKDMGKKFDAAKRRLMKAQNPEDRALAEAEQNAVLVESHNAHENKKHHASILKGIEYELNRKDISLREYYKYWQRLEELNAKAKKAAPVITRRKSRHVDIRINEAKQWIDLNREKCVRLIGRDHFHEPEATAV